MLFAEYLLRCLPPTTTSAETTVTSDWPRHSQCESVTLQMCKQHSSNQNKAWNLTCFNDTGLVSPQIQLCSTVCHYKTPSYQLKCEDFCHGRLQSTHSQTIYFANGLAAHINLKSNSRKILSSELYNVDSL